MKASTAAANLERAAARLEFVAFGFAPSATASSITDFKATAASFGIWPIAVPIFAAERSVLAARMAAFRAVLSTVGVGSGVGFEGVV